MTHQNRQIGSGFDRDPSGKAVIVSDVQEAGGALQVLLLGRADGVVGVDNGDDVQLQKLVDGREQLKKKTFF